MCADDIERHRSERIRDAEWAIADQRARMNEMNAADPLRLRLDAERRGAITAAVEGFARRGERLIDNLRRAPANETAVAGDQLFWAVQELEAFGQFLRHILDQRADLRLGQPLDRADVCGSDGYLAFAGVTPATAPPLTCLEAIATPLTYRRRAAVLRPGLTEAPIRSIPLPLVLIPPAYLASVWAQTTVQHEIGHDLDADLALSPAALPLVRKRLLGKATDEELARWAAWLQEIVADMIGVLLAGEAFAWTMMRLFDAHRMWGDAAIADEHPPAAVRVRLLAAALGERSNALRARFERNEVPAELASYAEQSGEVANTVLDMPVDAAGGRRLRDIPPPLDVDAVRTAAKQILRDARPDANLPPRLIPSAAELAAQDTDGTPAQLARVHDRATQLLLDKRMPEWVTPAANWDFLREQTAARPVILDRQSGLKVPPHQLLVGAETISFVGASNDQLPDSLARAFASRGGRKWARIEVFFLAPERLAWISTGGRPIEEVQRSSDGARQSLKASLPGMADRWAIYEYDRPFLFASFWDLETANARVHVSPYVWGENIRACPAIDYLRGDNQTRFLVYARGLEALRALARRLANGSAS